MTGKIQIIGVGSPLVDLLTNVSESFLAGVSGAKGGMELVEHGHITEIIDRHDDDVLRAPGGSAANTIYGLAKLGMNSTFLGKLGNDQLANFYSESFSTAGVCTRRLKYCQKSPTGHCLSMITPDSERTCRTYLGAAMNLEPSEVDDADFHDCSHAHIEGYQLFNRDLIYRVLESAKRAGCSISLDLASFEVVRDNRDILDDILDQYVDIVFANEDEAHAYCGSEDPLTGLHELGKFCDVAAVKLGADGAYIKSKEEIVHIAAEKVNAIDSTGAGDLWAAGFLYAYYNGMDLETCGRIASTLGAHVVQQIGAMIPDDNWSEIKGRFTL